MAQTIESFVGTSMDNAKMSPLHWRVLALVTAGYFFDVFDFVILGALVPDMVRSQFATPAQIGTVGFATGIGLLIGAIAQGEFTDRFGRKAVYQFNLLLYALATIAAAFSPNYIWLASLRFIAGIGLGAEQPLCFAYTAEYAPKRIRGRTLAFMQLIGGAFSWPLSTLFALAFRDRIGWQGIWIVIGVCALILWVIRFSLPESPRWLATHGKGERALSLLGRLGLAGPPAGEALVTGAASDTKSDPLSVVFRQYRGRVIAAMICFFAFFSVSWVLGTWLPNIMADSGFTITKSLTFTLWMQIGFPCSSLFMMFALEYFGRMRTAVMAFVLAGLMSVAFINSHSDVMVIATGFFMFFFVQLSGNSMQILTSEVFPTNARASGFGMAQGAGRLGGALAAGYGGIVANAYGLGTVFVGIAAVLAIAAFAVTRIGSETKGRGLDEIAAPTG